MPSRSSGCTTTLDESDATFKLVFSPTPIVGPDRDNKKDNHANEVFASRRQMSFVASCPNTRASMVFCGDRHWQYASVDDETEPMGVRLRPRQREAPTGVEAG